MRLSLRITALSVAFAATCALADHGDSRKFFSTTLRGYEEVPAVNTAASGNIELRIRNDEQSVEYTLKYSGLQGAVTQAHIHFAQAGVNGGIMVWLCGTAALPGPAGTPACPVGSGSVSGTFGAPQVIGPAGQQIPATDLASVIDALRGGVSYANVHTSLSPGGEIRGQIGRGRN